MAPPPTDDASGRPVSDEGDAADTPADDRATSRGDPGSGCGAGPAAPHPNLAPAAEPGAADDHAVGAPPHAAAHAQPTERRAPEADCSDAVGPARAPSGRPPGGAAPLIDTDAERAHMAAYARHSAAIDGIAASHGMKLPGATRGAPLPEEPRTSPAGDTGADRGLADAPVLLIDAPPTDAERRVLLAPISYTRPAEGARRRMVVYMPTQPGAAWGTTEAVATRRRRREAMCDDAATWLPHLGMPKGVYFHAGDLRTHGDPPPATAGAPPPSEPPYSVSVTVVLTDIPDGDAIATTTEALLAAAETERGVWTTIDALAGAATDSGGVARYRLAAAAAAKVDSYVQPTPNGPEFVRWGVRSERRACAATSERASATATLSQRVQAVRAEARRFQALLEAAADDGADADFAAFARELAPLVDHDAEAAIPEELRDYVLPEPPADLADRPYRHVAVVRRTKPLPPPEPQPPPPDGWWPHDVRDIVEADVLDEIGEWMRRVATWHQRGGRAHERPDAVAYGTDAIKPQARGRLWDLRDGPGNVKLFDPTTEPKRTCLNLDFAKELFKDCADEELLSMLLHGVQMKTDGLAHQIVLMPNLLSLYTEQGGVEAAAKQMADMRELGFLGIFT